MSAVFNAQTKSLLATFSGTIPAFDDHVLISCWVKWDSTQTQGSLNMALEMVASDASFLRVGTNSTNNVSASLDHPNAATVSRNTAGTYAEDAWIQFSAYVSPSSGGLVSYGPYLGTSSNIGTVSAAASTVAFSTIRVGQGGSLNDFSRWRGKIAEVSVWLPADATEAAAIVAELATKKANAVAGSYAPIWYATLESDATVAVGASLTNNGTTGFDGADNPTLSGGGDTTAPILSLPTGVSTGSTTGSGSVTTDEANGTLYRLASTNATETAATVIAAALSQTVTTTGVQNVTFTGLTASTLYYAHYVHVDAAANESNRVSSSPGFTTDTPDTTAPTLSSPTATALSNALIAAGVTTNEANGTLYVVATTSATPPTATQIRAGQDHAGAAAVFAANQTISSTGAKTFNVTGLTQLTLYYLYFHHQDAAANNSTVSSASATTFRNGATAQSVIDNTAAVGGNPAGVLYALALTIDPDDWMAYRTISGPTPGTGTLTENANGSFTYVGPDPAIWVIQPEVNGVDDAGGQIIVELYDQASDVTAPTLTTATGTKTGATTATGTVTTDEGLGTLYYLTNTSPTATDAAVLAGSTQTVTATGVQNISRTGLTAATTYYHHFLHKDPAGNDSAVVSSNSFTTDAVADTTAPTLTSPTGAALGHAGATGTVSTDEANGTLYWVTTTNSTETAATVKAGNSQAVTATGVQSITTGSLSASTTYYNHYVHRDAAGNDSTVASSASFATSAAPTPSGATSTRMSLGIGISLS